MNRLCKSRVRIFAAALLLGLIGLSPALATLNPDFELTSLNGEQLKLQEQVDEGKWLLVMFWATDCAICVRQKPLISKFHQEHKDIDAQVVGIALDSYANIDQINAYIAEHKPSFPSFTANYRSLAERYYAATEEVLRGTPTYLLYTPGGSLVANNPGPLSEGSIEAFIEKYRKSHP